MRVDNEVGRWRPFTRPFTNLTATFNAVVGYRRWIAAAVLTLVWVVPLLDAFSQKHTGETQGTVSAAAMTLVDGAAARKTVPDLGAVRTQQSTTSRSSNRQQAAPATPKAKTAPAKPKAVKPAKPAKPKPVAGLTQAQMDNAAVIVRVGKQAKLPKRAQIIAIATAMQESKLKNLANPAHPQSMRLPNQGTGFDYDSLGLFQQRVESGWGSPRQLMDPVYAAKAFYDALASVNGWQSMAVTEAAQAVQGSAFPDAYAQHVRAATLVVNALS
ncbi:MAG TPA: hypothetical protein VFC00_40810 [Micromonosporaceae bacterium]|nr:hypothetical protein [Micromonosporaceae bacterium]